MPRGEIRAGESGRLAIGQRVGDSDDQVLKSYQVRTERAGPESDDALPDLNRIDAVADRGHHTHAVPADIWRLTVVRIQPHRLEHVAEIEPRGPHTNLDLVGLRRNPAEGMHFQAVQPPCLIYLQPEPVRTIDVDRRAASLNDEVAARRCRGGHQPADIPLPVTQGHLVLLGT